MPCRRCTTDPTGFITALATRSLDTAVRGGTLKKRTSTGVMSAPPPMPVRPTTMPMPKAAAVRARSTCTDCPLCVPESPQMSHFTRLRGAPMSGSLSG